MQLKVCQHWKERNLGKCDWLTAVMSLFKRKRCTLPAVMVSLSMVEGDRVRETDSATFEGKIFRWWGSLAFYLMPIFTNSRTCGFTETFRREDRGDEQHMHNLFAVVVEKSMRDAKSGWWGSSESCGKQPVTPPELWQGAGCEGTGYTHIHEPNWRPEAAHFLAWVVCRPVSSGTQNSFSFFKHT